MAQLSNVITIKRKTLGAVLAGLFVSTLLVGYFTVPLIDAALRGDRIISFTAKGHRINRGTERLWFDGFIRKMKDEETEPDEGHVFGYPFEERSKNSALLTKMYRCFFNIGGVAVYRDYTNPPKPPCPQGK